MKVFLVMGIVIDLVTDFLADHAFAPLITQSSSQFGIAVSMSFTIAIMVLGLSYMIAHFIRLNVVELRSALMWYVLVALFFQLGPELYLGMNDLRADINSFFYATALQSVNDGSPLAPLNNNLSDDGVPMLAPCDNFGWLSGAPSTQAGAGVDGLDIGMAYMLATARDVLGEPPAVIGNCMTVNPGGYETNLPFRWYHTDGYFDTAVSPPTWEYIPPDDRERSLSMAAAAQYRLIGAWPLLWLGVFEKIVYLLVAFAQGLSFISFSVAAIFAFFKRTEAIARSVVDLWIEIIVTSVVIALGQSLIVSLALAAAATQNPLASIGVGLLSAVMMFILMISGIKLVWNALTRIFSAISQATGGAFIPPQQLAAGATVGAVGTVAAVATGGSALALAGAAMAGMSAAGIGGSPVGMAGSQLMMAGRMTGMSGARRMMGAGMAAPGERPGQAHLASASVLTTNEAAPANIAASESDSVGNLAAASETSIAAAPVTIAGYHAADLQPDSPAGRRTAHLEGRFTPLDRSNPGASLTGAGTSPETLSQRGANAASMPGERAETGTALRAALNSDSHRDESAAEARLQADNNRDDAALREVMQTPAAGQANTNDMNALAQAGRELQAAAGALKAIADQQQMDRVLGRMDVTGGNQVGAVVADAVDVERDYRQRMQKPMLEGAGEQFGGRMAQAVGMEPAAGHPPVSDPARFNAVGDQALRLGLNGDQVMQVFKEQAGAADGRSISPETQQHLVQHVRTITGARQREAQQQVGQFLNVAAALPDEVRLTGSIAPPRLRPHAPTEGGISV